MSFKVHARTIFHLGADLISSDSIALYELVKNAFDAGSSDVDIKWVLRITSAHYFDLQRSLEKMGAEIKKSDLASLREAILDKIEASAPNASDLREMVENADTLELLAEALDEANYIEVIDTGCGMTLDDLSTIYLSIGTPHRLLEKKAAKGKRLILGEKGVGRLAAMRLGQRLRVTTSERGESHWNALAIDWRDFGRDLDASLEDIVVEPAQEKKKSDKNLHGTTIHMSALSSSWDIDRVRGIANEDMAKLGDPFSKTKFPIVLKFNDEVIKIPKFESILTEYAHASMELTFVADGADSHLQGVIDYSLRKRKRAFKVDQFDLLSICELHTFGTFDSLGPFTAKLYWFNRQTLRKLDGSAELKHVISLQERWAGGLMVYRDGFRVNPYGTGDDDWLNLDRVALSSTGYKLNRRQIVGKVDISSEENPLLQDQTNREGIRDSEERRVLVTLLRHAIIGELKPFLEQCDEEAAEGAALTADEIEERVAKQRKRLRAIVKQIKDDYPKLAKETEIVSTIEDAADKLERLMDQARRQVDSYEEAQDRVLHLAGTGLLVEMVAHELNRATRHTLQILNERGAEASKEMNTMLRTLEAQLKTLQKRLRILDPLATAGRQVKETFDLVAWVEEIVGAHAEQFKRHNIRADVKVLPARAKDCQVKMVKGMLVQVLENLLSNSIYWLNQKASLTKNFSPEIQVVIDTKEFTVSISDNGPGITPDRRNAVFEPFVTTKPPGKGKGLGLFIAREIARYHKAALELADDPRKDGTLNTFVLNLGSVAA